MKEALVELVWERAAARCEYCRLPQAFSWTHFEIDHIIAQKHDGPSVASNLALACFMCNSAKGPNIAGIDADTGKVTPLFHPRRQKWARHFEWDGTRLRGKTPQGRTTVVVLDLNEDEAVWMRELLLLDDLFPFE